MDRNAIVAIDFDHTICEGNTDVVVQKLLAEGALSKEVEDLRRYSGWIAYMNKIFELIHENSVSSAQIENVIVSIPEVAGMLELLTSLHANGHEIIIISDSNSVFINSWLRSRQIEGVVSCIFTNPAQYDDDGRLKVKSYTQNHCMKCSTNLCKGQILTDIVNDKVKRYKRYGAIVYIGDGENDYCPTTKLSKYDLACPRKGYPLYKRLNVSPTSTDATIVTWENGTDLLRSLRRHIQLH